jgi:hypothetical protein
MKWLIFSSMYASFLLVLSTPAYSQNSVFEGHLSGIADGEYVYLTPFSWDSTLPVTDSAAIHQGKFTMQLNIPEGNAFVFGTVRPLQPQKTNTGITGEMVKNYFRHQVIYLEKGRIEISGNATRVDMAAWSGDPFIKEQNDYFDQVRHDSVWEKISAQILATPYGAGPLDEKMTAHFSYQLFALSYAKLQNAKSWIPLHPNSPSSTLALLSDMGGTPRAELEKYFNMLSNPIRNNQIGRHLEALWDRQEGH